MATLDGVSQDGVSGHGDAVAGRGAARATPELAQARRLVVKIGSALLVEGRAGEREAGPLRLEWLRALAEDVARIKARGTDVILVSSGSIALGRAVLGLPSGPLALEHSQAAAAVGQIRLARAYEEALAPHGLTTGQILVTLEDTEDRRRYLNSRATLEALLAMGVVPIVNENDTVATDEIRFGDNDRLAAGVAVMVGADQLVLLSDVDGFYTGNPKQDPAARRLEQIAAITPEIEAMAGDTISGYAKGGMKTKLLAAKTATAGGCALAITQGDTARPLAALEAGAACSWFLPQQDPQLARKRWIGAMKPHGELVIDAGAVRALAAGKSLLPAGVVSVTGAFGRGDPVAILDPEGHALGKGLTRYTAAEARAIRGRRTAEIAEILGAPGRSVLIHRDDMAF